MPVLELAQDTVAITIASHHLILIEFYAERCSICKKLSPVLDELAQSHPEVRFYRIDAEQQSQASMFYRISSVPTVLLYKDGEQVHRFSGYKAREEIEELISKM